MVSSSDPLLLASSWLSPQPQRALFNSFRNLETDPTIRKVCILPAKYLGYFLSHKEGVEPRQFLEEMQPVIEADGNAIALEPFITFAISSMTKTVGQVGQGPGPSAVLVAAPASVARNKTLLTHSQFILHSHLTGLGKDGGNGVNLTPLITAINDGHSQAAMRANYERQERRAKEEGSQDSGVYAGQGPPSPAPPPLWRCHGN